MVNYQAIIDGQVLVTCPTKNNQKYQNFPMYKFCYTVLLCTVYKAI